MAYHRVRVLRDGEVQTSAHVENLHAAREWGYAELRRAQVKEPTTLWAAVVESGRLFVDPFGDAHDVFARDDRVRDGLVLDKRMLTDPAINLPRLFGLRRTR